MSKSNTISAQVNRIPAKQGKQNPWKVNQTEGFQHSGNRASKKCTRCGKSPMHGRNDCPAKEVEYWKCFVKGHYAAMCHSKKTPKTGRRRGCHIGCHHSSRFQKERNWGEQPQSTLWNSKSHGMQKSWSTAKRLTLEWTPEPMSQSSQEDTSLKNSLLIQKTNKKIFAPGKTKIYVVSQFQATLTTEHIKTKQTLFIVGNLQEPLLGRPAIEAFHLLERVNTLQSQGGSDQNSVKNEFPKLFKGFGKLKSIYKITMENHAKPFSIATPRRLLLPMGQKVEEELKCMEEEDVMRPIKNPTEWCTPIVVVPKSNGKVRICIDLTKLNENIRHENFRLPSTD